MEFILIILVIFAIAGGIEYYKHKEYEHTKNTVKSVKYLTLIEELRYHE